MQEKCSLLVRKCLLFTKSTIHYHCALGTFLGHGTLGHDLDCLGAIQGWGRQEFSQTRVMGVLFESLLCEKVGLPLQLILKLGQR